MNVLSEQFKHEGSLKTFISDQFEGTLEYRVRCRTCGYQSSRQGGETDPMSQLTSEPFLQLEINLVEKASLESRIAHMLLPETLDGANKYQCPCCVSLQPATRTPHLNKLPPVLHFSLLRFVYDPHTETRKKVKAAITYPNQLDLGGVRYDLRGVVIHQGTSVSQTIISRGLTPGSTWPFYVRGLQ